MTTVTAALPFSRPLTRADLADTPDDGHRYELIDGVLVVTPGPVMRHQDSVVSLLLLLKAACPPALKVLMAPFAVALADDTELQPDLLVAPRSQFTRKELPGAPLLAIEVLSPSTRRFDLLLKRDRLQTAGCPSYWLVDPDLPAVTVLELRDGVYEQVGHVEGDEVLEVTAPFPVRLVPNDLLDD
jgi:Uma2 family endonuclease